MPSLPRASRALVGVAAMAAMAVGCSSEPVEPITPVPNAVADTALAVDLASARSSLIGFLEDYARLAEDDLPARFGVATTSLDHWAHWLNVRFSSFGGEYTAETEIRSIQAEGLADTAFVGEGIVGIQFDVEAAVHWRRVLPNGAVSEFTHDFSGPAIVVKRDTVEWLVADMTYNGDPLTSQVRLVEETLSGSGVEVTLESLLVLLPDSGVFANIHVKNTTERHVYLDRAASGVRFGDDLLKPNLVLPAIFVAPGEELDAQLFFLAEPFEARLQEPTSVSVDLTFGGTGGEPVDLRWVLIQGPAAQPSPTPETPAPPIEESMSPETTPSPTDSAA